MKKIQKIFSMLLVCMLLFSSCVQSNPTSPTNSSQNSDTSPDVSVEGSGVLDTENITINNNSPSFTQQGASVQDPGEHYQTKNVLHKVNVSESDRPFIVNKQSSYKIIIPKNPETKLETAVNFFVKYAKKATGCELSVETSENLTWSENSKWIVFGCKDLFASAGLTMPVDDIGLSGYYIKSTGNSVFVAVNDGYGYHRATLSLLDHIFGYEMYWNDTVVFEKTGETLPDMDIIERPDFDFYVESDQTPGDAKYGMGFDTSIFIRVDGAEQHNSFKYLPPATYKEQYPEWYSIKDGTVDGGAQLCYTARGDAEKYELMVQTVANKAIECMEANPMYSNITMTQEDVSATCGCDTCAANYAKYGAYSASIIMFMNDVDDVIQAYLEAKAEQEKTEKKTFNIVFFAYHKSEKPPVKKDANGNYVPVDEKVKCNPNVGVYIAPIYTNYLHSFYEKVNEDAANEIKGWAACAKIIYMWIYETNFSYYLYPYNSWDTKVETYRFLKEQGAIFMQSQGQWNNGAATAFTRLKIYMDSKAEFNVNVNFNEIEDAWFSNYFGPAAVPMRAYFDQLQVYLRYLEETYPAIVSGSVYGSMEKAELWPKQTLNGYIKYIDQAYACIAELKDSDPMLYNVYKEHILLESIFPRYALLRLYKGTYTAEAFLAEAKQLKRDCATVNITRCRERVLLETIWKEWGV